MPNRIKYGGRDANLLQAKNSGIPPGARWTKIDRRLVNPEALEDAKERFEERLDCVIVLRVLTKEEIQKLADRTRELRGKYRPSHYNIPKTGHGATSHEQIIYDCVEKATKPRFKRAVSDLAAPSSLIDGGGNQRSKERKKQRGRFWNFHATTFVIGLLKYSLTELSNPTDERYQEEREERKAAKRRERNHDRRERDEYEVDNSEDEFKPRAPKMLEAPSSAAGASTSDQADFIRDNKDRRRERDSEREYMSGGAGRRDDYGDR